jgi:hypothetical protein
MQNSKQAIADSFHEIAEGGGNHKLGQLTPGQIGAR